MSDRNRGQIKVSRSFYETHRDHKRELGLTWEEYIAGQRAGEGSESETDGTTPTASLSPGDVAAEVVRQLDLDPDVEVDAEAMDVDALAEALSRTLGSDLEVAAYRGAKDAVEELA